MNVTGFEIRSAQFEPGLYVTTVCGEIDAFTAPALEGELEWILRDGAASAAIDLTEVTFIDSSGLTVLMKALPRFAGLGGTLVLAIQDPQVRRTLELTGLDRKFAVEPTLAEAVAKSRRGEPTADSNRGSDAWLDGATQSLRASNGRRTMLGGEMLPHPDVSPLRISPEQPPVRAAPGRRQATPKRRS